MNNKTFLMMLLSVVLLGACNNGGEENHEGHGDMNHDAPSEDEIRTLDVSLTVPEETVSAGETVEFSAHVTSNDEDVPDAQVMYEVLDGEESLDMIDAEHSEDGVYSIEYTFEDAGEYRVISHVDAFQLHTMPEGDVVVE